MAWGAASMSRKDSALIYGKFPAVVKSYNANTRECIINTPTNGDVDAEIQYPIGDSSKNTEIKINTGDQVWCEFIQGDTRRALITGWRNPKSGNTSGTRAWEQDNIKLNATSSIVLNVGGMILEITPSDILANGISVIKHVHMVIKEGQNSKPPTA